LIARDDLAENTLESLAAFVRAEFASGIDEALRLRGVIKRRLWFARHRVGYSMNQNIRPPLIALKPFPLVVPAELVEDFLAAVQALDRSRSPEEYQERQRHPRARRHAVRRAEIEAVLQALTARSPALTEFP